jgi:lysophospholipase L1-like esterase
VLAALFVFIYFRAYRSNYYDYNLLRLDPLEESSLKDYESRISTAEIWMIGDSRIARWDTDLLKEESEIANLGIEGQTSAQVYYRLKNYLVSDTPSLIVLQVGINDLKIIGLDKRLKAEVSKNLCRNIEAICHLCIDRDIKVILMNIIPVGKIEPARRLVWNTELNEALDSVNAALKLMTDNEHVFYLDTYTLLSDNTKKVRTELQYDFLHINERGYEILSAALKEQIKTISNK